MSEITAMSEIQDLLFTNWFVCMFTSMAVKGHWLVDRVQTCCVWTTEADVIIPAPEYVGVIKSLFLMGSKYSVYV